MPTLYPNRVAAIFAVVAGVLGALAPVVADIDTASAAGLIAGLLAIVATVDRFLKGSQAHEERQEAGAWEAGLDQEPLAVEDPEADDVPLEDLPSDEVELAAPPPEGDRPTLLPYAEDLPHDGGDYPPTQPLHDGPGEQRGWA